MTNLQNNLKPIKRPDKTELIRDIPTRPGWAGLYIHIPFCRKKCPYCDFYSIVDHTLKNDFLKSLNREIILRKTDHCFDTLYFGGGTPSLLEPKIIKAIIESVMNSFHFSPDSEISMEVNPGTVDLPGLAGYKMAGINRINIGVQSFLDQNLAFLGRIHSAKSARHALLNARRAGFENIGIDLIYGIPEQTKANWLEDLESAIAIQPEHIACYMLTWEQNTPLFIQRRQGLVSAPDDQVLADFFIMAGKFLQAHGYEHYEISNFALIPKNNNLNLRSRHNCKYWSLKPYMGFGPAAHSFDSQHRSWNHYSLKRYIKDLQAGHLPVATAETLNREESMTEALYLGLRQSKGIIYDEFNKQFQMDFQSYFNKPLTLLQKDACLTLTSSRCLPTLRGWQFLDSIIHQFLMIL